MSVAYDRSPVNERDEINFVPFSNIPDNTIPHFYAQAAVFVNENAYSEKNIIVCLISESVQSFITSIFSEFLSASGPPFSHHNVLEITIDGKPITLNLTTKWRLDVDVCLLGHWNSTSNEFCSEVKLAVSKFKQQTRSTPIFIACNVDDKNNPDAIREAELDGVKLMNRKIVNRLAREVGAVKYIEFSGESRRGVKILADEIAQIAFANLQEDEPEEDSNSIVGAKDTVNEPKYSSEQHDVLTPSTSVAKSKRSKILISKNRFSLNKMCSYLFIVLFLLFAFFAHAIV